MNNNHERLNFKINIIGQEQLKRKPCNLRPVNLDKVLNWIEKQEIEDSVKEELKKMVKKYPEHALSNWGKNYSKHLAKAKKTIKSQQFPKPIEEIDEKENI